MSVAISQNVPAYRRNFGPLREWMKIAVAHAVCRLGMQFRGVIPSNGMECGASTGGGVTGHRSPIDQCALDDVSDHHRLTDAQCSVPVP